MLFNSLEFLVFFPVIFALLLLTPPRYRTLLLLGASYYFYMSWRVEYIVLILLSTFVDYFVSRFLANSTDERMRRVYLAISICVNLGLLFYFKYLAFFADSANQALAFIGSDGRLNVTALILPVGISFYTFQTLSYTIDVYRGNIEHEKNPVTFALFVSYFPQLVAGPIERSKNLLPQLRDLASKRLLDAPSIAIGLRLIAWGMFKKVVVADRLALYVNPIYNNPDSYRGMSLILATVFFAFQIYCDFSGYSDIAIGVARILGVKLSRNFNAPYFARSISEFWRRWHITLSTWFRDYVYIPLGGNRVPAWRWHLNIVIVFTVSGLWHGANWTFVIWGVLHGLMHLINHHLSLIKSPFSRLPERIQVPVQMLLVFIFVCFAWIFFRANSLQDAITIIINIFDFGSGWQYKWYSINVAAGQLNIILSIISILLVLAVDASLEWIPQNVLKSPSLAGVRFVLYVLLVFSLTLFGMFGASQEFVYFQF